MLSRTPPTTSRGPVSRGPVEVVPVAVTGRDLRKALHGASPATRARVAAEFVAAEFVAGLWTVTDLSAAQAARLCGVGPARVTVARGRRGARGPQRRTVAKLAKFGATALWQALDVATAPQRVAAE